MKLLGLKLFLTFLIFVGFIYWVINHSGYLPYSHNPMQYMPNMHRSPALRTQEESPFFKDNSGARKPPAGTISRNQETYPHTKEVLAEQVEKTSNPLSRSRDTLIRGKKMYETHCIVCHGAVGQGDGSVVPPFPKPPSLHSERVRGFADSQIFHIITVGQNTMNSYAPQVRWNDRWAIVHYIRVLQLAENPGPEDLDAFDRFIGEKQED